MATMQNKFRGSALGAAIGDALGAPRVGMTRDEIAADFPTCAFGDAPEVMAYTIPVGEFGIPEQGARLKPGQWTDDTQLLLALAQTILDEGGILVPEAWAHSLVRWLNSGVRGPGLSTLQAALQLRTGAVAWDEAADPEGGGCGAATRVAPVGLRYAGADELRGIVAVTQAQITHGGADAQAASLAMAEAVALAINAEASDATAWDGGAFLRTIRERVEAANPAFAEFGRCLALAETLLTDDVPMPDAIRVLGVSGWSREAVPCALYCVARRGQDFEALLCTAVSLTGDATDAIGCMVGAIGGAWHGLAAIPTQWRETVEGANDILAVADTLYSLTQS